MRTARYLIAASSLAVAALANGVELIDDQRRVQTFSTEGTVVLTPPSPFAAFNANGQNSAVSATDFAGSGFGSGFSDFDFFVRESIFDVTFSATEPTLIDLTGSYSGNAGDFGLANIRVRLFAGDQIDTGNLVYADALTVDIFKDLFADFDYAGSLAPGTYRLVLQTDITPGGFDTYGEFSFNALFSADPNVDTDGDGIVDSLDNCIVQANPDQTDADGDGYGNRCDADLNNDCVVNIEDLGLLRLAFFSTDPVADLNADGVVNVVDLGILRVGFFSAPGPAGQGGSCDSR